MKKISRLYRDPKEAGEEGAADQGTSQASEEQNAGAEKGEGEGDGGSGGGEA